MDDGATTTQDRVAARVPFGVLPPAARRTVQPHHRRRRIVALSVVAAIALGLGMVAGAGGGTSVHHYTKPASAYFARLKVLGGSGVGSFAAVERAAEDAAINRTLSYTPYVRIAGSQHREIALTFDDGPGPFTPQVLSVLARENIPGTFFEVGVEETYFHASTSEIAARGYPIGDHTESHAPMGRLSPRDQRTQLLQQITAAGAYGAPFPRLFRPPYGLWNNATLRLLHAYRMLMVLWTVDTNDYREPGVAAIVHSAVSGARPGAIILLHDAGGNRSETVAALPKITNALRARGYRLVTVPKLLLDNPPPHDQQISTVIGAGG
jgi:peptidoglycan/xylan/chitin deacetylase (PgdA/CDA1 family)